MLLILNQVLKTDFRRRNKKFGFIICDRENREIEVLVPANKQFTVADLLHEYSVKIGIHQASVACFKSEEGNLVLDSILSNLSHVIPTLSYMHRITPIHKAYQELKGISKFSILKKLGQGAFAEVFLGFQTRNNGS